MGKEKTVTTRNAIKDFMRKGNGRKEEEEVIDEEVTVNSKFTSKLAKETLNTNKLNLNNSKEIQDLRSTLNEDVDDVDEMVEEKSDFVEPIKNIQVKPEIPFINTEKEIEVEKPSIITTKKVVKEYMNESKPVRKHNTGSVTILDIAPDSGVAPLEISKIEDTEGYICKRVNRVEDETGISALPFNKLGLLPQVVYIKGHDIIELNCEPYVVSNSRIISENLMHQYIGKIETSIMAGIEFDESLLVTKEFENEMIRTLKFNFKELSYIKAKFAKLPCTVYQTLQGDMRINVGGTNV
ncbi:hypothetical protein [Paraclostridium bifermentans]|uniref:hypothetical protein n=1 Tax=Paraclostridium bifermentans TaxID=1490 RepID=UPI00374E6904